jgi:hypothetical protein
LQARIPHRRLDHMPVHGDRITVGWSLRDVLVFDAQGQCLEAQLLTTARMAA